MINKFSPAKKGKAVKNAARAQAFELARSAQSQFGIPVSESNLPAYESQYPSLLSQIGNADTQNINPEELKKRELELLAKWRQNLATIQKEVEEQDRHRQEAYQAWKKSEVEKMHASQAQTKPEAVITSAPKRAMRALGGIKGAIKRKQTAPETGRSSKH